MFDLKSAYTFGDFLARRYRNNAVLWYVGGDSIPGNDRDIWVSMAKGLKDGSDATQLVSYHGPGKSTSATWFHNDDWLDFNSIQSGHGWATKTYQFIAKDYQLSPAKPTLDMEPPYENHPTGTWTPHLIPPGAEGRLLGNAGWRGRTRLRRPGPLPFVQGVDGPFPRDGFQPWRRAMAYEGSRQVGLLRRLFELRPWHKLVPDQSVVVPDQGEGEDRIQAARADDGSFVIAYTPRGRPVSIHMEKISAKSVKARWYDPRDGTWREIGTYANNGLRKFRSYPRTPERLGLGSR